MNIKEFKEKYVEKLEFLHKEEIRTEDYAKRVKNKDAYTVTRALIDEAKTKGMVFILEQIMEDIKDLEV